jgi:hypothetical protein
MQVFGVWLTILKTVRYFISVINQVFMEVNHQLNLICFSIFAITSKRLSDEAKYHVNVMKEREKKEISANIIEMLKF